MGWGHGKEVPAPASTPDSADQVHARPSRVVPRCRTETFSVPFHVFPAFFFGYRVAASQKRHEYRDALFASATCFRPQAANSTPLLVKSVWRPAFFKVTTSATPEPLFLQSFRTHN